MSRTGRPPTAHGPPAPRGARACWAARAIKTRTAYFYNRAFQPFGPTWGAPFAPTKTCEQAPPSPSGLPSFPPGSSFPPGFSPNPPPSAGPTATVPDVLGRRLQTAERQLQAAGLEPVVTGTGPVVTDSRLSRAAWSRSARRWSSRRRTGPAGRISDGAARDLGRGQVPELNRWPVTP